MKRSTTSILTAGLLSLSLAGCTSPDASVGTQTALESESATAKRGAAFLGSYESTWLMPESPEGSNSYLEYANHYVRERLEILPNHCAKYWRVVSKLESEVNEVDLAQIPPRFEDQWHTRLFHRDVLVLNSRSHADMLRISAYDKNDASRAATVTDGALAATDFTPEDWWGSWSAEDICPLGCDRTE